MNGIRLDRSASGIATITLDWPQRKNAVPPSAWEDLRRAAADATPTRGSAPA